MRNLGVKNQQQIKRKRKAERRLRPTVLALEGRTLLSTFTVNSTADNGSTGTLRWAIGQANSDNQADTIVFSSLFNTPQTITLTGGPLALTDPATTTITGPAANLVTVSGNSASLVFDVEDGGSAALSGLTITGGNADYGGGVRNDGGALTVTDCAISGNTATLQGGGLATRFGGTTMLSGCSISGNSAADGGGVSNASASTLSLVNSTVSGNTASGKGGGLYNYATATLTDVTVSANSATTGGGLASSGSFAILTLTDTIVAGQKAGGDVAGALASVSAHNLVGDGSGMTGIENGSQGNQVGTAAAPIDPGLTPLGDYGGPTFTMALLAASPALGAGGTGAGVPTTDQRGFVRDGDIDIGAFQRPRGPLVVNTTADGIGSGPGLLSLRQAVNVANTVATADPITFSSLFDAPRTITLTGGVLVLADPATATITGPGADLLSISGNNTSGVFDIDADAAALSGLTITGGSVTSAPSSGGGLRNDGGKVSLSDCIITGNSAGNTSRAGGGLSNLNGGTMTLSDCAISHNFASSGGGGIYNGGMLSLSDCTISNNSTQIGLGGGMFNAPSSTVSLTSSTFSGNSANEGGGLVNEGTAALVNVTISGNSANDRGGGLFNSGAAALVNVTISGNSASAAGGGVYSGGPNGTLTLTNTIVAGQTGGGDIVGVAEPSSAHNLIGDGADLTGISNGSQGNQVGTDQAPIDPRLAPLGDYGGPTFTMALLAGSPAFGAGGSGAGVPTADQRGLARAGRVDVGAFQRSRGALVVNITAVGVGSGPGQLSLVQAVNLANSVATADPITFSSLFDTPQTITLTAGALVLADPATMTITGPGADLLTVSANKASRVFDIDGGSAALSGLTITDGNADSGGGLQNNGGTLTLSNCTVSGNAASKFGGGLYSDGSTVTLTNCTLNKNTASDCGAGLNFHGGTVKLTDCTISGNSVVLKSASTYRGGGVYMLGSTAALTGCTLSGNYAYSGGGLYNSDPSSGGKLTATGCTVSGNSANTGGGICNAGPMALTNCTISGNSATLHGGGLADFPATQMKSTETLTNCTVSANSAQAGGGLFLTGYATTLTNTIVSAQKAGLDVAGSFASVGVNDIGENFGILLAPLADYGGPTFTMALLPGSLPLGQGVTGPGIPTTDQRGQPRIGPIDQGAFQSQGFTLTPVNGSTPQSAVIGKTFANPLAVAVTANNPVEPVDGGVIFFYRPGSGASANLSSDSPVISTVQGVPQAFVNAAANSNPGNYSVTAAAASRNVGIGPDPAIFALTNPATLGLTQRPGPVRPGAPTTQSPSPTQGSNPSEVVVTDGAESLRAAIAYANSHHGPDTIILDPSGFHNKRRTITLIGGPLVLTDPATTTIIGPGTRRLTIRGGGKSRVFDIERGSLALSGIAITGGRAKRGGGIRNDAGTLSLTDVVIRNNSARRTGGGLFNSGTATLSDVVVQGNHARTGGNVANFGTLSLTDVTIPGKSVRVGSGIFSRRAPTLAR